MPLCSRRNYIAAQHQIFDVAGGNDDPLVTVKANRLASVEESLDLLIDTADCLDLAALIDRTSDCEALLDWRLGQGREQREQLGGRRAVAIDAQLRRGDRIYRRLQEEIGRKTMRIEASGEQIG